MLVTAQSAELGASYKKATAELYQNEYFDRIRKGLWAN